LSLPELLYPGVPSIRCRAVLRLTAGGGQDTDCLCARRPVSLSGPFTRSWLAQSAKERYCSFTSTHTLYERYIIYHYRDVVYDSLEFELKYKEYFVP